MGIRRHLSDPNNERLRKILKASVLDTGCIAQIKILIYSVTHRI